MFHPEAVSMVEGNKEVGRARDFREKLSPCLLRLHLNGLLPDPRSAKHCSLNLVVPFNCSQSHNVIASRLWLSVRSASITCTYDAFSVEAACTIEMKITCSVQLFSNHSRFAWGNIGGNTQTTTRRCCVTRDYYVGKQQMFNERVCPGFFESVRT